MWLNKNHNNKIQQEYKIDSKFLDVKGVLGNLEVYKSSYFGEIAKIGDTLLLKNKIAMQSEFLAHIGACSHKEPKRILIAGSFNLEIAYELLKHSDLKVDFLQFDLKILESLISFFPHYKEVFANERFTHIPQKNEEFLAQNEGKENFYDVIYTLGDKESTFASLLSENGILIAKLPNLILELDSAKEKIQNIGDFLIKMPFYVPLSLDLEDCYLLISKRFHPTADIALQRADMLGDLEYYHANLHLSAFVLPKNIKTKLLEVSKN